jgi:hypothetical protein
MMICILLVCVEDRFKTGVTRLHVSEANITTYIPVEI